MTFKEWKKNDVLISKALKKIGLRFSRNKKTWQARVVLPHKKYRNLGCFDINHNFFDEGPSTIEILGKIKYFLKSCLDDMIIIDNVFFGVTSYEELKIKLDLMT